MGSPRHLLTTQRKIFADSVARGLSAALGLFAAANVLFGLVQDGNLLEQNIWWIDSRPVPPWFANPVILLSGVFLICYAFRPHMSTWRRLATRGGLALLCVASIWNTMAYWGLLTLGEIASPVLTPLSLFVALFLAWLWWHLRKPVEPVAVGPRSRRRVLWRRAVAITAFFAVPVLFPLAQMFTFGLTDYRRDADAVVVFGAAVWPGNVPSHALRDRVDTGIELYQAGLVGKIVFSGGPSASEEILPEVDVMKRLALEAGIPEEDIILDPLGVNTRATAENCVGLFERHGVKRALAVSHFYHLPRVKMAFRHHGLNVYTVPAEETHILVKLPFYLVREVAALWVYYLRPLVR